MHRTALGKLLRALEVRLAEPSWSSQPTQPSLPSPLHRWAVGSVLSEAEISSLCPSRVFQQQKAASLGHLSPQKPSEAQPSSEINVRTHVLLNPPNLSSDPCEPWVSPPDAAVLGSCLAG